MPYVGIWSGQPISVATLTQLIKNFARERVVGTSLPPTQPWRPPSPPNTKGSGPPPQQSHPNHPLCRRVDPDSNKNGIFRPSTARATRFLASNSEKYPSATNQRYPMDGAIRPNYQQQVDHCSPRGIIMVDCCVYWGWADSDKLAPHHHDGSTKSGPSNNHASTTFPHPSTPITGERITWITVNAMTASGSHRYAMEG